MAQKVKTVFGSTKEAAACVRQKPQTLLKHYCEKGHYYGVVPVKMQNRILLWDMEKIEALASGDKS